MNVINVRKKELSKIGYASFLEWEADELCKHVYIGRNMTFYVAGTVGSKWRNPFSTKKYSLENSLQLYENHVRATLYDQLDELKGCELGCWCVDNYDRYKNVSKENEFCHGHVLIRLLREKEDRR